MERALDSFQDRVARQLTRRQQRRQRDGSWSYPPLEETMGGAGFERISNSIMRRKNTVAHYIETVPIMVLYERFTWRPGVRLSQRWWEQASIDLERAKKRSAEAATVFESDLDSDTNADSDSYADSDSEYDADSDSDAGSHAESDADADADTDAEADAHAHAHADPGGEEELSGARRLSGAEWSRTEE